MTWDLSKDVSHLLHSKAAGVLLLSGSDLRSLLEPKVVVDALRQTYAGLASSRSDQGKSLAFVLDSGTAHVKAGLLPGSRSVLAAKINVNLPHNQSARNLPTIQGIVLLADAQDGRPLAIMDSMVLTAIRTAGTALLAASFGARPGSTRAAVLGCGMQARYQVDTLLSLFPIKEIRVFDIDPARARGFAQGFDASPVQVVSVPDIKTAVRDADICITCTTSQRAILTDELDLTGCFVAAIGADNPHKCEMDPPLLARARVIVDDIEQCAAGGDLAHALRAGMMTKEDVHADLADLAIGAKIARETDDQLVIFDSSGSAVQDVATAQLAYEMAMKANIGAAFDFAR